jgi:hypothetical protein
VPLSTFPTTTTNSNGDFLFSSLADGNYQVFVYRGTLPSITGTWTQTDDPDETGVCVTCDDLTSTAIPVSGGNDYGPYIFGYHRAGSLTIGDTVYDDWNGDGIQQANSPAAQRHAQSVSDDNANGNIGLSTDGLITSATTNGSGVYPFGSLASGSYIAGRPRGSICLDLPPDRRSRPLGVTCTTCDSDGQTTLTAQRPDARFGYRPTGAAQIGDIVGRRQRRRVPGYDGAGPQQHHRHALP